MGGWMGGWVAVAGGSSDGGVRGTRLDGVLTPCSVKKFTKDVVRLWHPTPHREEKSSDHHGQTLKQLVVPV